MPKKKIIMLNTLLNAVLKVMFLCRTHYLSVMVLLLPEGCGIAAKVFELFVSLSAVLFP